MTDQQWKQKIQIIVAKVAMNIRLTITEKKFLLRYRAHEVVNRDRLKRAA
jgi:hypothetical protein